jgi:hypothetical protein
MGNIECNALRPRLMIYTRCRLILFIIKYEVVHIRWGDGLSQRMLVGLQVMGRLK